MHRSIGTGSMLGLLTLGWSATALSAVDMTMVSTTRTPGFGGDQEMEIRSLVDGDNGRYEFVSSEGNDMFAEGAYMLTNDGGNTLYLVNPQDMTYMILDLSAMMGFAGSMMEAMGGAIDMSFDNFSSELLARESGEDILGYSTTRYAFRISYDMNMSVFGMNRSSSTESSTEIWCTEELGSGIFNPFQQAGSMRTGIEGLDELIEQQVQFAENCAVLRSINTATVQGQRGETVSETRVTSISEVAGFDPEVFRVPEGFTETSLLDQMPEDVELPAGFPFGSGANQGEQSDDSAEEDDGRPLRRLRGIFGQ